MKQCHDLSHCAEISKHEQIKSKGCKCKLCLLALINMHKDKHACMYGLANESYKMEKLRIVYRPTSNLNNRISWAAIYLCYSLSLKINLTVFYSAIHKSEFFLLQQALNT